MGQRQLKALALIFLISGVYLSFFASAIQTKFAAQNIASGVIYENGEFKPFEWPLSGYQFPIVVKVKITDVNREFLPVHKPKIFDYYSEIDESLHNKSTLDFSQLTKIGKRTSFLGDDSYEAFLFKIENQVSGGLKIVASSESIENQRIRKIQVYLVYQAKSAIKYYYKFGIPIFLIGIFLLHKAQLYEFERNANTDKSIGGRLWGRRR